jgi:cobalt/nickel transport system permease protein
MMLGSVSVFEACRPPSRLDAFDPRCRVVCAFAAAATLALVRDLQSLAAGSVLPALLLCVDWRERSAFLRKYLISVNKIGFFIWIFIPITYPGERIFGPVTRDGLMMALVVMWKLNLISAVLTQMVASMGIPEIDGAIGKLGFPLKLRMLLMLTARYVILLSDRMATMWRAVHVRSGDVSGARALHAFSCMVATTLIHSSDRAERAALAMSMKGGAAGFSQPRGGCWAGRDSLLCAIFLLNSAFIIICPRLLEQLR